MEIILISTVISGGLLYLTIIQTIRKINDKKEISPWVIIGTIVSMYLVFGIVSLSSY